MEINGIKLSNIRLGKKMGRTLPIQKWVDGRSITEFSKFDYYMEADIPEGTDVDQAYLALDQILSRWILTHELAIRSGKRPV